MKTILALVLALALYAALGVWLPSSGKTALILTVLGTWGAFTYKGLLAMCAFGAVARR